MLVFRSVTAAFGSVVAVDGLSLECAAGETVALLGPSGCGKSTLLRMAVGLVRPDSGSVLFDGCELAGSDIEAVRRRIGYVIQDGGMFPHLDVWENVTLVARYLRWPAEQTRQRFAELLDFVKLDEALRTRRPDEISGGQRQRVALMRALMLDPPLLLLDEPLAALDPLVRRDLQRDLHELFQRLGKTVLIVSHDVAEAVLLGERIVLMNSGRIVQDGTPTDLLDRPATPFVRDFVEAQRGAREILAGDRP
jgi:osmoprotectant transport system ATP-binding protein